MWWTLPISGSVEAHWSPGPGEADGEYAPLCPPLPSPHPFPHSGVRLSGATQSRNLKTLFIASQSHCPTVPTDGRGSDGLEPWDTGSGPSPATHPSGKAFWGPAGPQSSHLWTSHLLLSWLAELDSTWPRTGIKSHSPGGTRTLLLPASTPARPKPPQVPTLSSLSIPWCLFGLEAPPKGWPSETCVSDTGTVITTGSSLPWDCSVSKHARAATDPNTPPCAQERRNPAPSLPSSLLSPGWGVNLCPELIPSGLGIPFPPLPLQSPSASLSTGSFPVTSSLFHLKNTHLHVSQRNYKRESILKHGYEEVTLSTSDCIVKMKDWWRKIQLVR